MELFDAIRANLLSPAVLFFALGVFAALVKSDLKFPEPLYLGLTIYLLVAIGFKGGVAIAVAGLGQVWLPGLAALALGALIPLWTYPLLRWGARLRAVDAAAMAAHYGSVSAVTFIAATNYLKTIGQPFEGYAVEGEGARGDRPADIPEFANIQIQIVVRPEVATLLLERLEKELFPRYGMIAFAADVQVLRAGKF